MDKRLRAPLASAFALGAVISISALMTTGAMAQEKRPNVVMLMTDDTGWNDFGAYGGGANLGHPTPNIDRIAQEGAVFTSWYGQASCTAGRASFLTGRIPIRSALSVVVVPGDEDGLTKSTPTIAEFFQKNGYGTYFSGKWHLGDQPKFYPIEHGFDEMKEFAAYYPGVSPMTTRPTSPIPGSRSSTPPIGTNIKRSSICTSGKARPASLPPRLPASTTTICTSSMSGRLTQPSTTSSSTPRTRSRSSWM
jgi:hypothetical protein